MPIGQKSIVDLPGGDKPKGDGKDSEKPKPSAASVANEQRAERDLRSRIVGIFTRIADAFEARGDTELADVIREDRDVMATGLVSLTRPFRVLRGPLMLLLAFVEPVLAFSRIGRLLLDRILDRRAAQRTGEPQQ